MVKKKARKKAKKKPRKKAAAKRARAPARDKAARKRRASRRATKKPARKVAPRRRTLRIKKRRGPLQLGLPLQMPLALGPEAYAERPVVVQEERRAERPPSLPAGAQTPLFDS